MKLCRSNRRDLLKWGCASIGAATMKWKSLSSLAGDNMPSRAKPSRLQRVTGDVSIYEDVVNVGVVQKNGRTLLIDSGDALIIEDPASPIAAVDRVLYTHYHRDQCSGVKRLARAGVKINVPESERQFFERATDFWLGADAILNDRYNFRPEIMLLRESVPVERSVHAGELIQWEGIAIRVVSTPGHTDGSVSYVVESEGKAIVFTGDLIYGPGQIWEFYSLQKAFPGMTGDYWGFGGAVSQLLESADKLLAYNPSVLVPSHGELIADPKGAIAALHVGLENAMSNYFSLAAWRVYAQMGIPVFKKGDTAPHIPMLDPLRPVELPTWLHKVPGSDTSYCLIAEDKTAFLFDCGFPQVIGALDRMAESGNISRVDAIWASHYHDDHTASINAVRRKHGSTVYVQQELQDIFENPMAYSMPCLFPEPIHIDHPLSEGEVINWKGYKLTAYYFPGQTLYHDGLLIERDGTKVFMAGDSFTNWGIDDYCSYNRNFIGKDGEAAGYERCLKLLVRLKPDLLCAAHWGPKPVSQEHLERTLDLLQKRRAVFRKLLPWDDPNFGLDPYWVRAYPYRQSILPGQAVAVEARVFNHSDFPQTATVELRGPADWRMAPARSVKVPAHAEGKILLSANSPEQPGSRRQVLGLYVQMQGRTLGEFTEAIVDFLMPRA